MKVYLAGPLFSIAERDFALRLKNQLLEAGVEEVVWPYELFDQAELDRLGDRAKQHIFTGCRDAITGCTHVIAMLDGTQVDDGTAWEIGFAYAQNVPVFGLRTDFRLAGDTASSVANAMIECSCEKIFRQPEELLTLMKNFIDASQEELQSLR